jgi:hypothetical protein
MHRFISIPRFLAVVKTAIRKFAHWPFIFNPPVTSSPQLGTLSFLPEEDVVSVLLQLLKATTTTTMMEFISMRTSWKVSEWEHTICASDFREIHGLAMLTTSLLVRTWKIHVTLLPRLSANVWLSPSTLCPSSVGWKQSESPGWWRKRREALSLSFVYHFSTVRAQVPINLRMFCICRITLLEY